MKLLVFLFGIFLSTQSYAHKCEVKKSTVEQLNEQIFQETLPQIVKKNLEITIYADSCIMQHIQIDEVSILAEFLIEGTRDGSSVEELIGEFTHY